MSSLTAKTCPTPPLLIPIPIVYFKPRILFPTPQQNHPSPTQPSTSFESPKTLPLSQSGLVQGKENEIDSVVFPKESSKLRIGTWTDAEHGRFLDAMKIYGNDWPSVVKYIGTRTANQVRSHAQKYYRKLRRKAIRKIKAEDNGQKKVFVVVQCYRNKAFSSKTHKRGEDYSSVNYLNMKNE